MIVRFLLNYNTSWGEQLVLKVGKKTHLMNYIEGGNWTVCLTGNDIHRGQHYGYEVVADGVTRRTEWRSHMLHIPTAIRQAEVVDRWIDRPPDSAFWSSAFRSVIFGRKATRKKLRPLKGNFVFKSSAAHLRPGQMLGVSGDIPELGTWQKALPLDGVLYPRWRGAVQVDKPFEYKYVIADAATGDILYWETGPNHYSGEVPPSGAVRVLGNILPKFNIPLWRGAGVAIPVFSLRTKESFGVGEFNDIKKMVDWAVATGQNFIQLLPVNDTSMTGTWRDSYPYNSVSSFALHPQFVNLPAAGVVADKAYEKLQKELNALDKIDYERVNAEKKRLLQEVFAAKQSGLAGDEAYQTFIKNNESWLLPYAVFCCLRDEKDTANWHNWGQQAKYSKRKAESYAAKHPEQVDFWRWIQYLLDAQLKDAVAYAHKHRVAIKGDLPIGVSPTSADAWTFPELFNLDMQAGAPPDAFSADGQNWGFPTYNWEKMAEDDFAWWRARLEKMSEYFDAYRIDHILGFFRIWEIPAKYRSGLLGHFSPALPYSATELSLRGFYLGGDKKSRTDASDPTDVLFVEDPRRPGWYHPRIAAHNTKAYANLTPGQKEDFNILYNDFFYHRHDKFWSRSAMRKLPSLLRSTAMLSCGEDLGMIPACVTPVMHELNILSLEIQRMPKDPKEDFADPARYPYYCVCTTGTHDTNPLRAWWEEDRALTQRYFRFMMHRNGDAPFYCEPWVAEQIVRDHLASPAMLAILPLQDYLAIDGDVRYAGNPADERINIPANPRHYWRWRMHKTVEELIADTALCNRLSEMIKSSGRGL